MLTTIVLKKAIIPEISSKQEDLSKCRLSNQYSMVPFVGDVRRVNFLFSANYKRSGFMPLDLVLSRHMQMKSLTAESY